jgi:hypothetical protein
MKEDKSRKRRKARLAAAMPGEKPVQAAHTTRYYREAVQKSFFIG